MNIDEMDYIRKILDYDPKTGDFIWLKTMSRLSIKGCVAGSINGDGYLQIKIRGKQYKAHRLAFLFNGLPAPEMVDHINRVRNDNRWENLRSANKFQNQHNSSVRKDNSSGHKGVSFIRKYQKWQVAIKVNGKSIYLGIFQDLELASFVASEARAKYHGEFAV